MPKLPRADRSPDIENGVIKWYAGDTFVIDISLDLIDQFGLPYNVSPGETVTMSIYNCRMEVAHRFVFENIQNNCIELVVDSNITALFPEGEYTYGVTLSSETAVTTIGKDNKIIVR